MKTIFKVIVLFVLLFAETAKNAAKGCLAVVVAVAVAACAWWIAKKMTKLFAFVVLLVVAVGYYVWRRLTNAPAMAPSTISVGKR